MYIIFTSTLNWTQFPCFSWISGFLSKGYKNEINESDLYSPTPDDDAHFLANELEKYL